MFDVGDLVVCVDDSLPRFAKTAFDLRKGRHYRVTHVGRAPNGDPVLLVNDEPPHELSTGEQSGWRIDRFRKIDAPDTEVSRLIRACKPSPIRVPA